MKAGVLAAGNGARIRRHSNTLKPLVPVAGQTLIEHVLNSLGAAGADEIIVIINQDALAVREHVMTRDWPFTLRWIVETTPTSMHSFLRLVKELATDGEDSFLLSTVDTIAAPETYRRFYAEAREHYEAAVTLALTATFDDEKPLFARCAVDSSQITALGDAADGSHLATAGIYLVRPIILREAEAAQRDGLDALRSFLGRLLERGYPIFGIEIGQAVDVDVSADVAKAEALLESILV